MTSGDSFYRKGSFPATAATLLGWHREVNKPLSHFYQTSGISGKNAHNLWVRCYGCGLDIDGCRFRCPGLQPVNRQEGFKILSGRVVHQFLKHNVSGVRSALHRDLLRRIHRCHRFRIYDTYEVSPPWGEAHRSKPDFLTENSLLSSRGISYPPFRQSGLRSSIRLAGNRPSPIFADRTILGARLKWWRTKRMQTIENVTSSLGVSTAAWGHWETGHTFPSGEMLSDISRLTGLPLQILFCPNLESCPLKHDEPDAGPEFNCCQCGRNLQTKSELRPFSHFRSPPNSARRSADRRSRKRVGKMRLSAWLDAGG
jgi:transcriptional regulator with XRE-family HTH domain